MFYKTVPFFIFIFCQFVFAQSKISYYKQGLQLLREQKYQQSITVLEKSLADDNLQNQSATFYLIGLAYYNLSEYDNAINNFEVALDLSKDPALDKKIDSYIEKSIRSQNLQDSLKNRHRLGYYLGIGYDSNIVNLNPTLFNQESTSGYNALYGINYSFKFIRSENYWLDFELFAGDNYTTDIKLKTNSTVQSSDALQIGTNLKNIFLIDLVSSFDYLNLTPNYKVIYMPVDTSSRSVAFNSFGINLNLALHFSQAYKLISQLNLTQDKSLLTYANPDDNQTAQKIEARLENIFTFSEYRKKASVEFFADQNNAEGSNQYYKTIGATLRGQLPMGTATNFGIFLSASERNYSKKSDPRKDKNTQLGVELNYEMSGYRNLTGRFARTINRSNSAINDYEDNVFSLVFSDQFEF